MSYTSSRLRNISRRGADLTETDRQLLVEVADLFDNKNVEQVLLYMVRDELLVKQAAKDMAGLQVVAVVSWLLRELASRDADVVAILGLMTDHLRWGVDVNPDELHHTLTAMLGPKGSRQ